MNAITHIYIIFIACCFTYGAWCLYDYIQYLHDTIEMQDDAINMLKIEKELLQLQRSSNTGDSEMSPLYIFPRSITH